MKDKEQSPSSYREGETEACDYILKRLGLKYLNDELLVWQAAQVMEEYAQRLCQPLAQEIAELETFHLKPLQEKYKAIYLEGVLRLRI